VKISIPCPIKTDVLFPGMDGFEGVKIICIGIGWHRYTGSRERRLPRFSKTTHHIDDFFPLSALSGAEHSGRGVFTVFSG
jgi:hypothetical protein